MRKQRAKKRPLAPDPRFKRPFGNTIRKHADVGWQKERGIHHLL
jgi:hypothetical protein